MTDASGNVVERLTYDSFGDSVGSNRTRYDYTGRERDKTTNLIYYRARWYDPQTGRFLSEDPIGFAGGDINLYGYVGNSPLKFTDPSGLERYTTAQYQGNWLGRKSGQEGCECPQQPEEFDWWGFFWDDYNKRMDARLSPRERQLRDRVHGWTEDPAVKLFMATTPMGIVATPARAPSFLGQASGPAIIVPRGAAGPTTIPNGKGFSFTGGSGGNGLSPNTCNVRIMDPTLPKGPSPGYPNGYASYSNGATPKPQTVSPFTGKTIPPSDPWWHIPLR